MAFFYAFFVVLNKKQKKIKKIFPNTCAVLFLPVSLYHKRRESVLLTH